MDSIAHGLWSWIAAKFANIHLKKKLNVWMAVAFGVMPDVASFAPLFVFLIIGLITGSAGLAGFPHVASVEPAAGNTLLIHNVTSFLYNFTHSFFVFLAVFFLVWLIFKKPVYEMLFWLVHILIDIPTHSYKFYPTPFLWPLSSWKFDGLSWATPWFMIVNYLAIISAYLMLRRKLKICEKAN